MNSAVKTACLLIIAVALTACSHVNYIKSGTYKISKNNHILKKSLFSTITVLKVNTEKKLVTIEKYQSKAVQLHATVLDKNKWLEDCHTNFSHEVLETWELDNSPFKHPLYIFTACFGGKGIYLSESLEDKGIVNSILFEPEEKKGSYSRTSGFFYPSP